MALPGTIDETIALIEEAGGSAFGLTADLEDAGARCGLVDAVLDRAGRIDILVNNAGFADYALVEDMSLETFDRTVEHYLRTPFVLTKAATPHMRKQGGGWIVNIGSVTGVAPVRPYREYNKTSGDVIYASCKAALHRFTQGVAAELLDDNIAVNCVGPSTAIRTPGAAQLIPDTFPTEPVEYLAETVLAMCHLPAAERTGLVAFSLHYPWSQQLAGAHPGRHVVAAAAGAASRLPIRTSCLPGCSSRDVRSAQYCGIAVAEAVAHAIPDDDLRTFRVEPAVHHRPVNGMHQVGAHQSVHVTELLLEYMSPLRCPDRIVDTTELPCPDGRHEARHRGQLVLETRHRVRVRVGQNPQQQGAVDGTRARAVGRGVARVGGSVDSRDRGVPQDDSEIRCSQEPFTLGVEP